MAGRPRKPIFVTRFETRLDGDHWWTRVFTRIEGREVLACELIAPRPIGVSAMHQGQRALAEAGEAEVVRIAPPAHAS